MLGDPRRERFGASQVLARTWQVRRRSTPYRVAVTLLLEIRPVSRLRHQVQARDYRPSHREPPRINSMGISAMLARPQNMKIEMAIEMAVRILRWRLRRRLFEMSQMNFTIRRHSGLRQP